MTQIFYLVLTTLTLTAAAAQWLPRDAFRSDIRIGPGQANAQVPSTTAVNGYPDTGAPVQYLGGVPGNAFATPADARGSGTSAPAAVSYEAVRPTIPNAATTVPAMTPPLPLDGPASIQFPEQEMEGAKVLARVGSEVILAGEVISSVNSFLARNGEDINSPQVLAQRDQLVKMRLKQLIETRAVLHEAKRKIPEEGYKSAMKRFDEDFVKTVIPQMLIDRKLPDVAALEAALKADGTTLERSKRDFAETVLCKSWVQQSVEFNQLVTHEQMLLYYQQHVAEYSFPAECRWEQLMTRFDQFPTKAAAYAALANAGNEVILGKPWAEVAKKYSQGSTAAQGGEFNWTQPGSLVSKVLDEAIFTLTVGALSPILEDEKGFHIIRVIERHEARKTPFTEAQAEIKKKILEERGGIARKKYVEDVRARTVVWTAYDDPATAPSFNIARQPGNTANR